ncbi:MAG: polymer-forming cytoskeletal protein [Tissierellales bacterium]
MIKQKKLEVLIGVSTSLTGDIETQGSVTVEGSIKGSIKARGDIVFTKTATAKGEFIADNIILNGNGEGILKAKNYIKISSTADFIGDTYSASLISDEGAKFTGKCYTVRDKPEPTKKDKKEKAKEEE